MTIYQLSWGSSDLSEQTRYFGASYETDANYRAAQRIIELDTALAFAAYVTLRRMPDEHMPNGQTLIAWTKTSNERPTIDGEPRIEDVQ